MREFPAIATALILAAGSLLTAAPSHAQSRGEIVIGVQCDRTGPTQIVGTVLCPGFHDYIALGVHEGDVIVETRAQNRAHDLGRSRAVTLHTDDDLAPRLGVGRRRRQQAARRQDQRRRDSRELSHGAISFFTYVSRRTARL